MTGIRKKNKILGFIFAVLAVWMVIFQNPSYAAQRGSLNVKTEQAGMTVYLYRVAEKQAGVYVLNEKFQASGADVSGGGSREAAITLTDFVKAQGIQPYRTGTGSGKHVVFRNLPDGEALYLVTGDPMTVGGKTYIPAPVLVEAGGAAAEADIKCDIEEPENPTKPTDPSNPTSPTRYYDDSDDDDWDPTPNKKPTITTAADETVTITDAERTSIQTQIEQYKQGISDIAKQTSFNTKPLLDGTSQKYNIMTDATGNGMKITTADATLQALGIADFDVTKDFDLTQVDDALARVSAGRSGMGAQSNALEYAYRYSTNTRLNVTAGKSRLEDLDYGQAVSEQKKKQTLQQYAFFMQKKQMEQRTRAAANFLVS